MNHLDERPPVFRSGGSGWTGPSASTTAERPSRDTVIRPAAALPLRPDQLIGADARRPGSTITKGGIRNSNVTH